MRVVRVDPCVHAGWSPWQVHEKGILYAALPIAALSCTLDGTSALLSTAFAAASVLSCRHLLTRDGVMAPAVAAAVAHAAAVALGAACVDAEECRARAAKGKAGAARDGGSGSGSSSWRMAAACTLAWAVAAGAVLSLEGVLGPMPMGPQFPYIYRAVEAAFFCATFAASWLAVVVRVCR